MGLFSALLGLPLAPLRGVVWVGERVQEEAERVHHDPSVIRRELEELDAARAAGEISDQEHAVQEDALVRRLTGGQGGIHGY